MLKMKDERDYRSLAFKKSVHTQQIKNDII